MLTTYLTLSSPARADLRVKASRFFGFAERVSGEEEAAAMRSRLKKEYHDASHQPFAYRLSSGAERSSDDGEPKGTSGPAILMEIRRAELHDVQVVVVRYFGGTKLGKGGLAQAFGECTRAALESSTKELVKKTVSLTIQVIAADVKTVRAMISEYDAEMEILKYDPAAYLKITLPEDQRSACYQALLNRFGTAILIQG